MGVGWRGANMYLLAHAHCAPSQSASHVFPVSCVCMCCPGSCVLRASSLRFVPAVQAPCRLVGECHGRVPCPCLSCLPRQLQATRTEADTTAPSCVLFLVFDGLCRALCSALDLARGCRQMFRRAMAVVIAALSVMSQNKVCNLGRFSSLYRAPAS